MMLDGYLMVIQQRVWLTIVMNEDLKGILIQNGVIVKLISPSFLKKIDVRIQNDLYIGYVVINAWKRFVYEE